MPRLWCFLWRFRLDRAWRSCCSSEEVDICAWHSHSPVYCSSLIFLVMVPWCISLGEATLLLLNHLRFVGGCWCVLDVYVSLCLHERRMPQKDKTVCAKDGDWCCMITLLRSLLLHWRIIAILPWMIANSYDFPRKGGRECKGRRGRKIKTNG